MNSPRTYLLDDDALAYVRTLLINGLVNPEFSYSITLNKSVSPHCNRATDIAYYDEVVRRCETDETIYCVDITIRTSLKGRTGKRIILAGEKPDGDYNALELAGYPNYQTSAQR